MCAAEECVENVAESAVACVPTAALGLFHGVATSVDDAAFVRVTEYFLREGNLAEFLGGFLGVVDIGVVFAGQFTVGLFDLGVARIALHAEDPVVISCHGVFHGPFC